MEAQIGELLTREAEATNAESRWKSEKVHLEKQLERKTLECEELAKSHLNRFSEVKSDSLFDDFYELTHGFKQIKDKEDELLANLEETHNLKSRNEELESSLRSISSENDSLKHRLKLLEKENTEIRDRLYSSEPKLQHFEPEFIRLREEKDKWTQVLLKGGNRLSLLTPLLSRKKSAWKMKLGSRGKQFGL